MHSKLAGHLPLQDLIRQTIDSSRTKLASAEKDEKVKKLVQYEKKEHGHIPSVKEEKEEECETEKTSSAINFSNYSEVEKLAAAMDFVADDFLKIADKVELGGESSQGGMVLPTNSPVSGGQTYKGNVSKKHQVPMSTPEEKTVDNPGPANHVQTNMANPAYHKSEYPAKGVLKTASVAKLEQALEKRALSDAQWQAAKNQAKANALVGGTLGTIGGAMTGSVDDQGNWSLPGAVEEGALHGAAGATAGGLGGLAEGYMLQQHPALSRGLSAATGAAGGGVAGGLIGHDIAGVPGAVIGGTLGAAGMGTLGHKLTSMRQKAYADAAAKLDAAKNQQGAAPMPPPSPAGGPPPAAPGGEMPKQSAAVNFILNKIANTEKQMGGMTLDSPSGVGPKPPSDAQGGNKARRFIDNIWSAIKMKKVDGKEPQKKMLSEVLTEPAMSHSTDNVVHQNLRNATAGGVKIAAQRALLQKIAEDANDPRHEKLAAALGKKDEKRAQFAGAQMSPMSGVPTPNPM